MRSVRIRCPFLSRWYARVEETLENKIDEAEGAWYVVRIISHKDLPIVTKAEMLSLLFIVILP
jgi:hypothetical protein